MSLFSPLLSIFIVIFLGILCARKQILEKSHIEGVEQLLIKIIIPSYLFSVTYRDNLSELFYVEYMVAYVLTFGIVALCAFALFYKKVSKPALYIRMLSSAYVNAAIYALPVVTLLLEDPTSAVIGNILQVIVIQPIFIILLTLTKHKEKSLAHKLKDIFLSPLIVMPIAGILLNYFHVAIPVSLLNAINLIGSGASSIALFAFGLALGSTYIAKSAFKFDLISLVFLKNIVHPAVALGVAYLMKLESYWYFSLLIAASTPTAFVVYLIAKQFSTEVELVRKVVTVTAFVSLIELVFIAIMLA